MKIDIYNTNEKYDVIYADPPWEFKYRSKKGELHKSAQAHYECMKLEDIMAMPVENLAKEDCILFMWTTFPFLEKAFDVIKAWGFEYKTVGFVWVKRNKVADSWFWGCGHWTRSNAEICLLATKGNPKRVSRSVHQVCDARVREHSRKPDEIRDRIVKLCGGGVHLIELFARQEVPGWDCFGNEV